MTIKSITIEINNYDNTSMSEYPNQETIRILQDIIKNIKNYGVLNCDGKYLRDINGNTVGEIKVGEQ